MSQDVLKLALQKSGRLSEGSVKLLKECGIKVNFGAQKNALRASASNFPLEIFFLRDDDIPGYVADGVADIGIVGENVLEERTAEVNKLQGLGFSRCRLSIGVPRDSTISSLQDLEGKSIATTYPRILKRVLQENRVEAKISYLTGSVGRRCV